MEVKYIVNQEKRKIVCVITEDPYKLDLILDNVIYYFAPVDYRRIKKTYVGIATCAAEDEWNEEFGRKLAFDRAKTKLDRTIFSAAQKTINYLDKQIDRMMENVNAYGDKLTNNATRRREILVDMANKMWEK